MPKHSTAVVEQKRPPKRTKNGVRGSILERRPEPTPIFDALVMEFGGDPFADSPTFDNWARLPLSEVTPAVLKAQLAKLGKTA